MLGRDALLGRRALGRSPLLAIVALALGRAQLPPVSNLELLNGEPVLEPSHGQRLPSSGSIQAQRLDPGRHRVAEDSMRRRPCVRVLEGAADVWTWAQGAGCKVRVEVEGAHPGSAV